MQTVSLTWQHSAELAGLLAVGGAVLARSPRQAVRTASAFARETALIGVLYALWQLVGKLSVTGTDGAFARARWIDRIQADIGLPSEQSVQHLILGHPLVVQAANLYYATMHFSSMLAFLIWLFVRHRDRYRPIRTVMAWTTLGCLLIQFVPVAPPRMLPGIIDTGLLYNQSVYSTGLAVDQLSAMPSVHVAWAVIVGWYLMQVSTSRWRWIGPAHATVTVLVVVATGNHWWADGIVAVAVLVPVAWAVHGVRSVWRTRFAQPAQPAPVYAATG